MKRKGENEGVGFDRADEGLGVSESGEWGFLRVELAQTEL
jgi:hypothetical protein